MGSAFERTSAPGIEPPSRNVLTSASAAGLPAAGQRKSPAEELIESGSPGWMPYHTNAMRLAPTSVGLTPVFGTLILLNNLDA
jgi:hypothetical protein